MFDRFNQTLNFAADPPDGGGGTKLGAESARVAADPPDGGGGTKAAALGGQTEVDSIAEQQAIDPPENTAIDPPENTGGSGD